MLNHFSLAAVKLAFMGMKADEVIRGYFEDDGALAGVANTLKSIKVFN